MLSNLPDPPLDAEHIPGFPGYAITRDGRVFSCKNVGRSRERYGPLWRAVPAFARPKYLSVSLWRDNAQFHRYIHRLILETFIGPAPDGAEACHYDGNHTHNTLDNLRWDTRKRNHADKKRHGTTNGGGRNGNNPLAPAEAEAIRNATGSASSVARAFGVCHETVRRIRLGQHWSQR